MKRLSVTTAEQAFLDEAVRAAERVTGKRLSRAEKNIVLNRAREQVLAQRDAARVRRVREEAERHGREFVWKKSGPFRR